MNDSNKTMKYWLVVDTLRVPDAMDVLKSHCSVEQAFALYAGSALDYALDKSPMVVDLGSHREASLSCLLLPGFATSAVVFDVTESVSAQKWRSHLQSISLVEIDRQPMMVRFYTDAFWEAYAQGLNDSDKRVLLGDASAVNWLSSNQRLQTLSRPEGENATPPYALTSSIFKH
ncbi:DUF4123 domain-containing protein [Vibrio parahaemolyticus]|uniref:DUF4123 domain-containing protein n=1 Tax=Vibrio parahaemolyticus TaxID=670 RepID=UPI00068C7B76|nr:DUF4123 domain-containing protein [Vibrio parahaemolyticus]ELU8562365.1 DUF4123 domain-containing protein [Vibrio parahaemolyticus]